MTEQDIQYALGQHLFLKNVCIPNVLMSGVKKAPYEADFIYFNLNKLHLTILRKHVTMIIIMLCICIMQFLEVYMMIIGK